MFVNCSNHSSDQWDEDQIKAAEQWGKIVDFPFPYVSAESDEEQIQKIVKEAAEKIMELKPDMVMCQGEFTVTYGIVKELKKHGISSVAACSERRAVEEKLKDGSVIKTSEFRFVRFRRFD